MKKVEVKSEKTIFEDFFNVEELIFSYERFNGQMSEQVRRLNFERGDSVAVILMNRDSQQVILTNQFRISTHKKGPGWITEAIAGTLESNEDPDEAIRREILEETGYEANDVTHIGTFYLSPGSSSERIILYYSEVSSTDRVDKGGGLAEEGEDIAVVELALSEIWSVVADGQIADAKTVIGLMWLQNKLTRELAQKDSL